LALRLLNRFALPLHNSGLPDFSCHKLSKREQIQQMKSAK
jgi:hypothetical protein